MTLLDYMYMYHGRDRGSLYDSQIWEVMMTDDVGTTQRAYERSSRRPGVQCWVSPPQAA